jgi:hypothetical protein
MDYRLWHFNFKQRLDKLAVNTNPDFNPAEIDEFMLRAIEAFMRENTSIVKGKGFELNDVQRQKLSTLVVTPNEQPVVAPTSLVNNVYEFPLTSPPFLHQVYMPVRARVNVSKPNCDDAVLEVFFVDHDDLHYIIGDSLHGPSYKYKRAIAIEAKASSTLGEKSIYVYSEGEFTVNSLELTYIKTPTTPTIGGYIYLDGSTRNLTQSDLPDQVHNEVVDIAVEIAANVIGEPNAQRFTYLHKDKQ